MARMDRIQANGLYRFLPYVGENLFMGTAFQKVGINHCTNARSFGPWAHAQT